VSLGDVALIWAQTEAGVIGHQGSMPWRLPEDLKRFKRLTWGHAVIMGRRTWESLPGGARPLPGRVNVVLTGSADFAAPGARLASGPDQALELASQADPPVWVIGGGRVFGELAALASRAEVTVLDLEAPGDTWAPALDGGWELTAREPAEGWLVSQAGPRYRFETWLLRT
jgi:dihydrofolate reductase